MHVFDVYCLLSTVSVLQLFLVMMSPQPVQRLLTPGQLQALLHQQQRALLLQQQHLKAFYKKQQEQLNIQLLQHHPDKAKEQLVFQQLLQLHQQLLRVQRPLLCPPTPSAAPCSPADIQQIWKDLTNGPTEQKGTKTDSLEPATVPSSAGVVAEEVSRGPARSLQTPPHNTETAVNADRSATHTLYSHGVCNWPGCESVCENISRFIKHLGSQHSLDDRSTAQCRVQMQVVQQLDRQLLKERERLNAMMAHLHLPPLELQSLHARPPLSAAADPCSQQWTGSLCSSQLSDTVSKSRPPPGAPTPPAPVSPSPQGSRGQVSPGQTSCSTAIRQHHHIPLSSLTSDGEYELYRNTDIRPPFTYAALIRQAIVEARDRQLTLNEIYSWFTTFAYFKRNAATWKNAVRHNLSLHKCFVRVENVKGAVWTVNEEEYQRRRSQKVSGFVSQRMKNVASGPALGGALRSGMQGALGSNMAVTDRNLSVHPDSDIHRSPDASAQPPRSFLLKEEALALEDQATLTYVVMKPAGLRQGTNEELSDLQ
ncbi:forkhead box protein P2-like [Lampris incognitus]|uniref:forkhead box protein P2-like n=1 Tax=Lampris incognitus TaxID=2546036 RepID=UPI0024B54B45|nr:forkhead box protein P2-like [Lampris incognitus]